MFSEPEKNVEALGIRPNELIADFGAGGGAYTLAAAKALGGSGRVYAIDVQKDLLTRLQNTLRENKLSNTDIIWGNLEEENGTKLGDRSVDVVICSNVLFQNKHKEVMLGEARRVLKPNGRLLVVDWTASFNNLGPRPQDIFPEHDARALAEKLGFQFARTINAGAFHYGLIFNKI